MKITIEVYQTIEQVKQAYNDHYNRGENKKVTKKTNKIIYNVLD